MDVKERRVVTLHLRWDEIQDDINFFDKRNLFDLFYLFQIKTQLLIVACKIYVFIIIIKKESLQIVTKVFTSGTLPASYGHDCSLTTVFITKPE